MPIHAKPIDCPCCFDRIAPGNDTDTALVSAFLGGIFARDQNVPMGEALCAKHAEMCHHALTCILAVARDHAGG